MENFLVRVRFDSFAGDKWKANCVIEAKFSTYENLAKLTDGISANDGIIREVSIYQPV